MGIVLGLLGALTYGASDFVGGLASRRARALTVVVGSQFVGLLMALVALPVAVSARPTIAALAWGAAAGLGGGVGVTLLYRGLAVGRMSVVAPVTGLLAATLPVLAGLALGERPTWAAALGVVVALIAIVLVSSAADDPPGAAHSSPTTAPGAAGTAGTAGARSATPAPPPAPDAAAAAAAIGREPLWRRPGLPEAMGAGAGFGAFFILLAQTGPGDAVWPLLSSKVASVVLLLAAALLRRAPLRPPAGAVLLVIGAGVLDMSANALYLLATRYGLMSLVAVLTSLYPAATILLARVVLHERLARVQVVGLLAAACGVVLITAG